MRYKYHNKKIINDDGVFDSKLEYERWKFLVKQQEEGLIYDLKRQQKFELIPRQTERVFVKLKTKTNWVDKFLEHPVYYKADFSYITNFEHVVEDTKGFKTPEYVIKRKLLLYVYGIKIKEIKKANEPITGYDGN